VIPMNQQPSTETAGPTRFVLFGAMGDLTWRLVGPALYNLHLAGQLPAGFRLLGVDRSVDADLLRERLRDGANRYSRNGSVDDTEWAAFASCIDALAMDLNDRQAYDTLKAQLGSQHKTATRIFYLAIPPSLFGAVADGLAAVGLHHDREHTRIVVEKPLGDSLVAFQAIDRTLRVHFEERQVYRMDHFLGKETVQNIRLF